MKSFTSAALFVAAVLAQDPATSIVNRCQNSVDRNLSNTPATVRPIAQGLFQINITTGALDDQVLAFDGSQATIDSLLAASGALLADIANATTTTSAVEPLTTDNENDALYVVQYVADVVCTANKTVADLIAIKGAIVDACQGPVALSQLQQQLAATTPLINITANKIPDDQGLSGFARVLAQPILDSLQQGIDAYADQTALPASCSSTSTSTTTVGSTATTTVTSTATSADAGVTTTTAVAGSTYGSGGHGGSYTTVTEDCDESSTYGPTKSASYSPAPTGGNGGGAYHSGAPYPTGPYSSSGPYKSGFTTSCTEGAYYGSSSASKSSSSSAYGGYPSSSPSKGGNGGYGGAVPSSSAYGGNGGYGGAVPSSSAYGGNGGNGGYPSSSAAKSSYVPSSSASKGGNGGYGGAVPTGGYSSGGKSNSTGGYGSSPYTGAAASSAANVFGLLVAAIGAVALL